jgi:hypothetical protein
MTHSKDALFVAMVDFNLPTIEVGFAKALWGYTRDAAMARNQQITR